jgi:Na+-translocating ferredoxin:NAD+ oxidoreductase RnfD subunit
MFWLTLIIGLFLVVAPWLLGFDTNTTATWTSVILGAVLAFVSGYKATIRDTTNWVYWVAAVAGIAAVLAPWVFGFTTLTTAAWAIIIAGTLALVLAIYQIFGVTQEPQV